MTPPSISSGLCLVNFAKANNLTPAQTDKDNAAAELAEQFTEKEIKKLKSQKANKEGMKLSKFDDAYEDAFGVHLSKDKKAFLQMFDTNGDKRITWEELVTNYAILNNMNERLQDEGEGEKSPNYLVHLMYDKVEAYNQLKDYTDEPNQLLFALRDGNGLSGERGRKKDIFNVKENTRDNRFNVDNGENLLGIIGKINRGYSGDDRERAKIILAETVAKNGGAPRVSGYGEMTFDYEHYHKNETSLDQGKSPRWFGVDTHGPIYAVDPRKLKYKSSGKPITPEDLKAMTPSDYSQLNGIRQQEGTGKLSPIPSGDGGDLIKDLDSYEYSKEQAKAVGEFTVEQVLSNPKIRGELIALYEDFDQYLPTKVDDNGDYQYTKEDTKKLLELEQWMNSITKKAFARLKISDSPHTKTETDQQFYFEDREKWTTNYHHSDHAIVQDPHKTISRNYNGKNKAEVFRLMVSHLLFSIQSAASLASDEDALYKTATEVCGEYNQPCITEQVNIRKELHRDLWNAQPAETFESEDNLLRQLVYPGANKNPHQYLRDRERYLIASRGAQRSSAVEELVKEAGRPRLNRTYTRQAVDYTEAIKNRVPRLEDREVKEQLQQDLENNMFKTNPPGMFDGKIPTYIVTEPEKDKN